MGATIWKKRDAGTKRDGKRGEGEQVGGLMVLAGGVYEVIMV